MASLAARARQGRIPEVGMTVVAEPESEQPSLDIVFVHGFTGSPYKTWAHPRGNANRTDEHELDSGCDEPRSKIRKLHAGFRSRVRPGDNKLIYWPRDLLPTTVPGARILTYGYDTRLRHKIVGPLVSDLSLYDIAKDLLSRLEALRDDASRPILFICHSLGGIVVKEMLRQACHSQESPHFHSIYRSTTGIIFFGTPHRGADPRNVLHRTAEKVARVVGVSVNDQILNTLLPNSERLRQLIDEFNPIARKQQWNIHSFQEANRLKLLGDHRVVDTTSSSLDLGPPLETTEFINSNHMDMCRFTGADDSEYVKVATALRKMTTSMTSRSRVPSSNEQSLDDAQLEILFKTLHFTQINSRLRSVKAAHKTTCRWFLTRQEYRDWLDPNKLHEHHGFLWVKGKPGAGKSTLMKFVLEDYRRLSKLKLRDSISFFFNARGAELEKSTIGMYRSLLVQLLGSHKRLLQAFDKAGLRSWEATEQHIWTVETLKEVFKWAIRGLGLSDSVTCFIDALDECPEGEVRDMVEFFDSLGTYAISNKISFRVFFSSRHYPHITISTGLDLVLEGQQGHSADIKKYVEERLMIKLKKKEDGDQLVTKIQEKASGVFMWVVLVVDILIKSLDDGRPTAYIKKKLDGLPKDLHELFRNILIRDELDRDELQLCLQCLLFARRPLTPKELYCAIYAGTQSDLLGKWEEEDETVERFVLSSSKGLCEVTVTNVVQFIHESVRDFLLKEGGLKTLWPDLSDDFEAQSHDTLKHCCINYLNLKDAQALTPDGKEISDSAEAVSSNFPFLEYATQNLLYHADAAAAIVNQKGFFSEFPRLRWVALYNLFEGYQARRYTSSVTLMYIMAENNLCNLIPTHASESGLSGFEPEPERFGPPLFAARATVSDKAALAILQTAARAQQSASELHDICKQFEQNVGSAKWDRSFNYKQHRGRWYHVLKQKDTILASFFLAMKHTTPGMVVIPGLDNLINGGNTALGMAAELGSVAMAKLLLDAGANIEALEYNGRTPLYLAVEARQEATTKLLLNARANTEICYNGWTPLCRAAADGQEAITKLLLAAGASIKAQNFQGRTPLCLAAKVGQEAITKPILDTGANRDTRDKDGRTPLSWAAENGHEGTVKVLVQSGCVVEAADNNGRTPLSWAAGRTRWKAHNILNVEFLVRNGAMVGKEDKDGNTPLDWARKTSMSADDPTVLYLESAMTGNN